MPVNCNAIFVDVKNREFSDKKKKKMMKVVLTSTHKIYFREEIRKSSLYNGFVTKGSNTTMILFLQCNTCKIKTNELLSALTRDNGNFRPL